MQDSPELAPRGQCGTVVACILTYNRKDTLLECLRAVLAQTRPVNRIIVYDNGSSDGTAEALARDGFLDNPRLEFVRLEANVGPAGGFNAVLRLGYDSGNDWLWAMDDDVIPEPDALDELSRAYEENFEKTETIGFLVSRVQTPDGQPNNVPDVDTSQDARTPPQWAHLLHRSLVRVRWSTLNSVLFPRTTIRDFGLPSPDFFYGGDDIDLTMRVAKQRASYLVGRSLVTHLRSATGSFHPLNERNAGRVPLYFFYYRNQIYLRRAYMSRKALLVFAAGVARDLVRVLVGGRHRATMARMMVMGLFAGFVFRPRREAADES